MTDPAIWARTSAAGTGVAAVQECGLVTSTSLVGREWSAALASTAAC